MSEAMHCPSCGRRLPPAQGGNQVELQACGRYALPVPHVGLCFPTDDKGGFAVRWSTRPVQTSRHAPHDETIDRRRA